MKTVTQLLAERKKGYQNIDLTGSNLMVSKIQTTMHDSFGRELALREENKRMLKMFSVNQTLNHGSSKKYIYSNCHDCSSDTFVSS